METHGHVIPQTLVDDVAVDWINDKLYIVEERAHNIIEYDMLTEATRLVLDTGSNSAPSNIAVYPYPGQGSVLHYTRYPLCMLMRNEHKFSQKDC